VREIRRAVERIDVPAELGVEIGAGSLFAVDAVRGKGGGEARDDELFAGAVGFGDEVNVALVLGADASMVEGAEKLAGLARDGLGCG
jgi:hypothetical protein